ncbi:putative SnoaL-like aldol condensation-catalyzing enzyme [Litoreibacter ponti]|uniref:Putative SnoaL-like aldol condensation-catalyzing enzyme n=1 Tax=Litoreibacter ponti TaxID=1510457 RepID=A0A2T6BCS2_9RHOB|nr:nuclear transport factor 2 family protein [Litoreibacter ponti]PTX53878.1 putative SnoaL-like aldol condensation-catalyzing enzyme [Litoreibacter ponti]
MMTTSTNASNKALVEKLFLEGFSKNNADVLREVLSEGFVLSSAGAIADDQTNAVSDRDALIAGMRHNHNCFEGWGFVIEHIMASDNHVAVRWTATGKHVGSFMDEGPTGEMVTLKGNSLYRIENGKIVADWVFANQAEFGAQLGIGALPPLGDGEKLVRGFWSKVINAHDPNAADALMAKDYKQHAVGIAQGPEGFKAFFRDVLASSQGMKAEVLGLIEAETLVVSSTRISFDVPPEGWSASQTIIDVFRTDGMKLLEHWDMAAE